MSRTGTRSETSANHGNGHSHVATNAGTGAPVRIEHEHAGADAQARVGRRFAILGQGTALPEFSIGTDESLIYAEEHFCKTKEQARRLKALYRLAGVKTRHTVVLGGEPGSPNRQPFFPAPKDLDDLGPSTRERLEKYEADALPLALDASRKALSESAIPAQDITHLITVSCSGFAAPGVDIGLIKGLGLRDTVQRTHVGFMGCHGALNGLRVARGFTESDPNARVLLCAVELCSLHYHYGWDNERVVANALFSDGAAAVVGAAQEGESTDAWRIGATGSCLIPDSEDAMTWRIGDHGFDMSLSARVPQLIGTYLGDWIKSWLAESGLALKDIKSWAVHPGGPRILGSVVSALELDREAVAVSREVLRNHGNMSSPTLLFILKQLREDQSELPCVALGFGPGLMAEATLFV